MSIIPPTPSVGIVDNEGRMQQEFLLWTQIASSPIITGSGSPEGVVSAEVSRLYMDVTGSSGSILYIKRDAGISGDSTQGWVLV